MKKPLVIIASIFFLALCAYFILGYERSHNASWHTPRILRVSDRSVVSLTEVLEDLAGVRLVCIGELHTAASHHRAQLAVIRALHNGGRKIAVGLEMFRAEEQEQLNRWTRREMPEQNFVPLYFRNWSLPWELYADIFLYCRDNAIPMIGLNVPGAVTRHVARKGFSSLAEEQLKHLPPVSCDVDQVYQDFIRRALGDTHKHGADFEYFCEAQLVWDTAMAWQALRFLKENPNHTLVILAGSGHAWKRGIPEQIRRQSGITFRVILPEKPTLDRKGVKLEDTDYLWLDLPLEHAR
ncbi:MAG TPA: hypothetical protein EYP19_00330 [Desulfobacterales bacterium]|nr:hypothetical protein [Desulfobacterales bacterium]